MLTFSFNKKPIFISNIQIVGLKQGNIDILCIQRFFGFDVIEPLLKNIGLPYKFVESSRTQEIEDTLLKNFPKLIILEASENLVANKLLLDRCREICPTTNIVFLARFMPVHHVVELVKCGAKEIIDSSELNNSKLVLSKLIDLANNRKPERRVKTYVDDSEDVAAVGKWEYNVVREELYWSRITKEIHEVSDAYKPNVSEAIGFYLEGETREKIETCFKRLLESGVSYDLDLEIETAKGNKLWVNSKGSIHKFHGVPLLVYGTFQDITERKKLELELTLSDTRYQKVIEATKDVIWEYDLIKNVIIYAKTDINSNFKLTSEKELTFNDMVSKIHPSEQQKFEDSLQVVFSSSDVNIWQCDYRVKDRGEEYIWINDNASIVRDKEGKAIKLIGAARNVTATKEYLKSIENQNNRFQEIAWTQSHLLRPPVVNILGLVDLIKSENASGSSIEKLLIYLAQTTEQLDDVVKQIVAKSDKVVRGPIKTGDGFIKNETKASVFKGDN